MGKKYTYIYQYLYSLKTKLFIVLSILLQASVPSRDVYLHYLNNKIRKANDEDELEELQEKMAAYIEVTCFVKTCFYYTIYLNPTSSFNSISR